MNALYLDIKTIPEQTTGALEAIRATIQPPGNISKQETIDKWMKENADAEADKLWRKTGFDGSKGEIVCIGFALNDGPVETLSRGIDHSECGPLAEFYARLSSVPIAKIVGHAVKDFDLRFLFQRSVIKGIQPSIDLGIGQRYPAHVFDTMTEWAGWGNRIKLSAICNALKIPVKTGGIDGSMVWDAIKEGRVSEVATYCAEDVDAVRSVYKRMTFQGV